VLAAPPAVFPPAVTTVTWPVPLPRGAVTPISRAEVTSTWVAAACPKYTPGPPRKPEPLIGRSVPPAGADASGKGERDDGSDRGGQQGRRAGLARIRAGNWGRVFRN
jgi:hypothetical protein